MGKRIAAVYMAALMMLQAVGSQNGNRAQDDYYEFINQELLSEIELEATDAGWGDMGDGQSDQGAGR